MNVDFKIVWFEDEDSTIKAYEDDIKSLIRTMFLLPKITRYRNSDLDLKIVNDADLVLADYDLQDSNSVDILTNSIRYSDNYVYALLYSSKPQAMDDAIRAVTPTMEGVFCVKRDHDEIIEKLRKIISRIVKRSQSLENLRGIVMEYVSIFDKKIVEIIRYFCKKQEALDDTLEYINRLSYVTFAKKFYECCTKEKSNCNKSCENFSISCSEQKGCCFSNKKIMNLEDISKYDLSIKSRIFNHLLAKEIKKKSLGNEYLKFHKNFDEEIIRYRNALAHEISTDKKLYILATHSYQEVNDEFFSVIRKNIVKYIELFDNIHKIYNF